MANSSEWTISVVDIFEDEITKLVSQGFINEAAWNAAFNLRLYAQSNIIQAGAVDSRELLGSFEIEDLSRDQKALFRVGPTVHYAKWVEEGRGPIHARPGGVLAFKPKGSSKMVFAKRVGPAKGIHFMRGAKDRLTARDFE